MLAAAFYPRFVLVRFSDFKTNEYRNLLGGAAFEPHEENPMLGFRGAARYIDPAYTPAFALECAALSIVRSQMGLTNVQVMVPFVRTVDEARACKQLIRQHLPDPELKLYMMVEVPSNVLLIEDFSNYVDGFSIGSNDLTQLTLGVDRDSTKLAGLFNENDPAVQKLLIQALKGAHRMNKPIGVCGQGPSDHPELALFLIEHGITSISLNSDAVLPFLNKLSSLAK